MTKTSESPEAAAPGAVPGGTRAAGRANARLGKWSIARKLPLVILASGLISAGAVSITNYVNSATAIRAEAEHQLSALLEARRDTLNDYLESIRQDLRIVASNTMVHEALADFTMAWGQLRSEAQAELQRLYITENPHPLGQKEELDRADDDSYYSQLHGRYHPWFRSLLRERGYYDIFLFDPEG
ncbi:MAG: hypothetical protein ACFCUT_13830, partial [Kiloniellaceae bacterium]